LITLILIFTLFLRVCLADVKTGIFCSAENRAFVQGVDDRAFQFDFLFQHCYFSINQADKDDGP